LPVHRFSSSANVSTPQGCESTLANGKKLSGFFTAHKQFVFRCHSDPVAKALTRTAIGSLRSIQKQPTRIQNYFQQKDVCYAA